MTNGTNSNGQLAQIEAAIAALAIGQLQLQENQKQAQAQLDQMREMQQRTQEQLDREMTAIADLRAAQVISNQNFEMIGELIADNSRQIGELTQRAEQDRAEIRQIWEFLMQGKNGHSNGGNGG